jgi:hypothetical protein
LASELKESDEVVGEEDGSWWILLYCNSRSLEARGCWFRCQPHRMFKKKQLMSKIEEALEYLIQ